MPADTFVSGVSSISTGAVGHPPDTGEPFHRAVPQSFTLVLPRSIPIGRLSGTDTVTPVGRLRPLSRRQQLLTTPRIGSGVVQVAERAWTGALLAMVDFQPESTGSQRSMRPRGGLSADTLDAVLAGWSEMGTIRTGRAWPSADAGDGGSTRDGAEGPLQPARTVVSKEDG